MTPVISLGDVLVNRLSDIIVWLPCWFICRVNSLYILGVIGGLDGRAAAETFSVEYDVA